MAREKADKQLLKDIAKIVKRELGRGATVRYDAEIDAVFAEEQLIRLANIRRVYGQLDKKERTNWLSNVILDSLRPSPIPDVLTDTSALRPGLRSGSYFESTRLMSIRKGVDVIEIARRQLVPDLYEVLAWDLPMSISVLPEKMLTTWSRSLDELLSIAKQNLAAVERVGFAALDNRVFRLMNGDDYDSARLLIPEVLEELPVDGDLVGVLPTRNTLLVTSADDEDGIRLACELALEDDDGPVVFKHPLVQRDGEWSLLTLSENHAAYLPWRTLTRIEQAEAANNVQHLLQDIVGEDIFVASVGLRESPYTGRVESLSVWTRDVPTLLPKTDVVAFNPAEDGGRIVEASWDSFVATMASQLEPTNHYPMRWRVEGYPTPSQLVEMSA